PASPATSAAAITPSMPSRRRWLSRSEVGRPGPLEALLPERGGQRVVLRERARLLGLLVVVVEPVAEALDRRGGAVERRLRSLLGAQHEGAHDALDGRGDRAPDIGG